MSDINIIATQLELSSGIRRDRSEFLLDAEMWMPPPAVQKRGILYILVEVESGAKQNPPTLPRPADMELARDTQLTILKEFYEFNQSATVTSAMRHALEVANQAIFNRNSTLLPPERRGLGITLALSRSNEMYIAQMPPTQAYAIHQGQLMYFPTPEGFQRGPKLVVEKPEEPKPITESRRAILPALGRYSTIEPLFNRIFFDDGDLLVLCSSALASALQEDQLERYFLNANSREALYNLAEFARKQNITDAYAIAIGAKGDYSSQRISQAAIERSEIAAFARRAEEGGLRNTVGNMAASVSAFASRMSPRNSKGEPEPEEYIYEATLSETEAAPPRWQEDTGTVDKSPRQSVPPVTPKKSLSSIEALIADNPKDDPWLRREEDTLEKPPYLRNRSEMGNPPNFQQQQAGVFEVPPHAEQMPPPPMPHVEPPRPHAHAPQPGFSFGDAPDTAPAEPPAGNSRRSRREKRPVIEVNPSHGNENPYFDVVSGPPLDSIPQERRIGFRVPKSLLIVALVGLLAVAALFLVWSALGIGGSNDKALTFVQSAESKRVQAQSLAATSPARARLLITQAQEDLANAKKEKPDLKDITITQNALKVTLDNINKVVVPQDLRLSLDLSSQGAGLKLGRALFSGTADTVFIMDSGRGQILQLDMQGQVKTLLKPGDTASGKTFKKPVLMAQRLDSIIVADDTNVIWMYDRGKNSWSAIQLGGSAGWAGPIRRMDTYQGNLYVLGPAGGQIMRYLAGGYNNAPDDWLSDEGVTSAQLDTASGFAVDGRIFALTTGGSIVQMERGGKAKGEVTAKYDLKTNELIGPAVNNPSVFTTGSFDYPYIFVVDAEKRILQFQKSNGAFVQQFRTESTGKEFDNIRDLLVDEVNQKLYVVGDQKLYVFRIPAAAPASSVTVVSGTATTPAGTTTPNR